MHSPKEFLAGRRHARMQFARFCMYLPLAGEELWSKRTYASRQVLVSWLHVLWSAGRPQLSRSPTRAMVGTSGAATTMTTTTEGRTAAVVEIFGAVRTGATTTSTT